MSIKALHRTAIPLRSIVADELGRSDRCPINRPSVKHSFGGWSDLIQSRSRAIRYPFFGALKSAPETRRLGRSVGIGQIRAETASSIQPYSIQPLIEPTAERQAAAEI
jgi:hypothetical protein